MTFIPSPSPRALAFDRMIEETTVLARGLTLEDFHPEVRDVVAELGHAASNMFLPNIIDGVAEVPNSVLDSNGYGLVPLFPGEEDIQYGATFGRCTPQRIERMTEQYAPFGIPTMQIQQMTRAFAARATPFGIPLHEDGRDASVSIFDGHVTFRGKAFHMSSRPLVTVAEHSANVVLQMLVEAEDCERGFYPPLSEEAAMRRRAIEKLRAYHVGYVAAGGTQFAEGRTLVVEQLRRMNLRPGQPAFEPSEDLIQYLLRWDFIP